MLPNSALSANEGEAWQHNGDPDALIRIVANNWAISNIIMSIYILLQVADLLPALPSLTQLQAAYYTQADAPSDGSGMAGDAARRRPSFYRSMDA